MKSKRLFRVIGKKLDKLGKLGASVKVLLVLAILAGFGFGIKEGLPFILQKFGLKADVQTASVPDDPFVGKPKFPTVVNWHSLNELDAPKTETEWTFEKDHLDFAIGSSHAAGLKERGATTKLAKYILLNTADGSNSADGPTELEEMRSYCETRALNFENAFLHYSEPTVATRRDASNSTFTVNGSSTKSPSSRVISNVGYGDFYVLYQASPCAQQYKAYRVKRAIDSNADGTKYANNFKWDAFFIDVYSAGHLDVLNSTSTGGRILEYNKTLTDFTNDVEPNQYHNDQASMASYVYNYINEGRPVKIPLVPNSAQYFGLGTAKVAQSGGGIGLSEFLSSESQQYALGQRVLWDSVKNNYLDKGIAYLWSEAQPDPDYRITAGSNYPDKNARHKMFALSSYLMAKQRDNRLWFTQKNKDWYTPLSLYWYKAREANLGQPSGNYVDLGLGVFKRDYDSGVKVYFRTTYSGQVSEGAVYDDPDGAQYPPDYTVNYHLFNEKSQTYSLGGNYKVLYADGTLGPVINQIGLSLSEGVVLVPDGYNPFGTEPPKNTTDAKISLSPTPIAPVDAGNPFTVNAKLEPNGNNICSAAVTVNFPPEKASYVLNSASTVNATTQKMLTPEEISPGEVKFVVGFTNCTTSTQDMLTFKLIGKAEGTGNITISTVQSLGGANPDSPTEITTQKLGTSFTINTTLPSMPNTSLEITNGAVKNAKGYYTTAPIIKLTGNPPSGRTVSSVHYQWSGGQEKNISGNIANNISVPGEGSNTLTYWSVDSLNVEEIPHNSITFKVDTTPPDPPGKDPFKDHTYKDTFELSGNAVTDVVNLYVDNNLLSGTEFTRPTWKKTVNLQILTGSDGKVGPNKFTVKAEDEAGNSSTSIYNIYRHKMGDMTGDMWVDDSDFGGIMGNWGVQFNNYLADFNSDNSCNEYDFAILMYRWEPSS